MHKFTATLAITAMLSGGARAQTAQVQVFHDDPDGRVLPGETISMRTTVSWSQFIQFAGLKGSAKASNHLGIASSVGSPVFNNPSILVHLGVALGGSVVGFDVATTPACFQASPTWQYFVNTGSDVLTYDWTAPNVIIPTIIEFSFVADPIAPNVRLYPSTNSPAFVEAQTTYTGTSILVLPAPSVGAALTLAGLLTTRRRRSKASTLSLE